MEQEITREIHSKHFSELIAKCQSIFVNLLASDDVCQSILLSGPSAAPLVESREPIVQVHGSMFKFNTNQKDQTIGSRSFRPTICWF